MAASTLGKASRNDGTKTPSQLPGGPRGKRLLPRIVDDTAKSNPDAVFWILTESLETPQSRTITYKDLARAVDRFAPWLETTLGTVGGCFAFQARDPYDLRYWITLIAAIKTGHTALFPSTRNSFDINKYLFQQTSCRILVSDSTFGEGLEVERKVPPCLESLLAPGEYTPYKFVGTFDEIKDRPAFIYHSSGSTGPPKPITWTSGKLGAVDLYCEMPVPEGTSRLMDVYLEPGPHFSTLPFFHVAGFNMSLFFNLAHCASHITLPPGVLPTADNVAKFIKTYQPRSLFSAPSILEDMTRDEKLLSTLDTLSFVHFGGASVVDHALVALNQRRTFTVVNGCGSTETACFPSLVPSTLDAVSHFHWASDMPGIEFQEHEGMYELVFKRTDNIDWPVFHSFPNADEYHTKDLYERHPLLANHWKLVARSDDVLVMSNGEKFVPLPMEGILKKCPKVKSALIIGHGRFTVAALVELEASATSGLSWDEILEGLRPCVEEANREAPSHAKLSMDMIIFTQPDRPMARTGKGTVIRGLTNASYEADIEALYNNGPTSAQNLPTIVSGVCEQQTVKALRQIITETACQDLRHEEDFFHAGMDSGNVAALTRRIKSCFQTECPEHADKISASLIYANPCLRALSSALRDLANDKMGSYQRDHDIQIQNMIRKYGQKIIASKDRPHRTNLGFNRAVAITGTTGSLGSYILHEQISDPLVQQVYALNRSNKAAERQQTVNATRGLSTDFTKVKFIQASFDLPCLGLDPTEYRDLCTSVDLVIHNAWPVNFNQNLESFEPHVRGVRNLVNFCASSPHDVRISFVSSVGTTGNWASLFPDTGAPEDLIDDVRVPLAQGYSASKYVSEHILEAAAVAGVKTTICRVGQVAGPVIREKGMWNKQEWLPSLVQSSRYLRLLPESLGSQSNNIDWIPVDLMAKIIVELAQYTQSAEQEEQTNKSNVFNLVNRNPVDWTALLPTLQSFMPEGTRIVPFDEWYAALQASSQDESIAVQNPALNLMDFWAGMQKGSHPAGLLTGKTTEASHTMRHIGAVDAESMRCWMRQWDF